MKDKQTAKNSQIARPVTLEIMKDKQITKNIASPVIFLASAAMIAFITYIIVRGAIGQGVLEPGPMAASLLVLITSLAVAVWGTIFFIGCQLYKISKEE